MRSLIFLFITFVHSPSAFTQEPQQGGFLGYGQNGVLQIGPQGMQLIVPDQKTGGLTSIDMNQPIQIPPPASTADNSETTTSQQQQEAGVAETQPLQAQVQPQQLTCECNCPQPQGQPLAQSAPQESRQSSSEAGVAAEDQGGWGQEEATVQQQPQRSDLETNEANP